MTETGKRKLSAKQILADIRSGMDSTGLKRKYDLSDKGLESVCTRLVVAGALAEHEIRRLASRWGSSETTPEIPKHARWKCPACHTLLAAEMPECPVCGIVVQKFAARQGQVYRVSGVDSDASPDAGRTERTGWMSVIISIVIFAIAGSSLLLWSANRSKEVPKNSGIEAGAQSLQEAGTEADQTQQSNGEPEGTTKNFSEVEAADNQDTTVLPAPVVPIPQETREQAVIATREKTPALPEKPSYVTGELRRFSSGDFKKEVVEASKSYPVLLQFYSDT